MEVKAESDEARSQLDEEGDIARLMQERCAHEAKASSATSEAEEWKQRGWMSNKGDDEQPDPDESWEPGPEGTAYQRDPPAWKQMLEEIWAQTGAEAEQPAEAQSYSLPAPDEIQAKYQLDSNYWSRSWTGDANELTIRCDRSCLHGGPTLVVMMDLPELQRTMGAGEKKIQQPPKTHVTIAYVEPFVPAMLMQDMLTKHLKDLIISIPDGKFTATLETMQDYNRMLAVQLDFHTHSLAWISQHLRRWILHYVGVMDIFQMYRATDLGETKCVKAQDFTVVMSGLHVSFWAAQAMLEDERPETKAVVQALRAAKRNPRLSTIWADSPLRTDTMLTVRQQMQMADNSDEQTQAVTLPI